MVVDSVRNTNPRLWLFYCGGKAHGARIETHDIIIAVGEDITDCYEQIKKRWFGVATKLHIDGYILIDGLDGHRIECVADHNQTAVEVNNNSQLGLFEQLSDALTADNTTDQTSEQEKIEPTTKKLYFVNLGGTIAGNLYEYHEGVLLLAASNMGAMSRARSLSQGGYQDKHVDNIIDVDDTITIADELTGYSIRLIKDSRYDNYTPPITNSYIFVK